MARERKSDGTEKLVVEASLLSQKADEVLQLVYGSWIYTMRPTICSFHTQH